MDEHPTSAEHPRDGVTPNAVPERFHRMVEVHATKARLAWRLPDSVEPDLRASGYLGLSEALASYDASRGTTLATHVECRVHSAISHAARAVQRTQRIFAVVTAHGTRDTGDKWERVLDAFEDTMLGASLALTHQPVEDTTPEEQMLREEDSQRLRDAMSTLPEHNQNLLRWMFVDELEGVEIAARLGVHKSTVTRLKTQALSQLARQLRKQERDAQRGA